MRLRTVLIRTMLVKTIALLTAMHVPWAVGEPSKAEMWSNFIEKRMAERNRKESSSTAASGDTGLAGDNSAVRQVHVAAGTDDEPVLSDDQGSPDSIVYTRVRRTHGSYDVILRDGTPYTLQSPDIWDRLPDTRHVFDGFNAPGQIVLRETGGNERILYDCFEQPVPCVPLDIAVSLDGRRIAFSVYRGRTLTAAIWDGVTLPNIRLGSAFEAQLFVIDLESGRVAPLAHKAGVFDVSPAWLPNGQILFASTRDHFREPWLDRITPNRRQETQLFIADADGENAVNISPHEVTSALHPYVLQSGRVAYSSQWLSHNLAYGSTNGSINWPGTLDNMWVIMDMDTRGGDMTAVFGAHRASFKTVAGRRKTLKAMHFLGQRADGDICASNYYRGNNLGLGDVVCWQPELVGVEGKLPNFVPRKLYSVANWSKSNDEPSFRENGIFLGKIGYPEGTRNNQLLLTVGRGYCTQVSGSVQGFQDRVANQPDKRACDVGLYRTSIIPSKSMSDLIPVVDSHEWHEFGARVVWRRQIDKPELKNTVDGSCEIASSDAGTAETGSPKPYEFNHNYKTTASYGGEIDGIPHIELAAMRFWEVLPNTSNKRSFENSIGNRLRLLGDVPLLPDKSFKVQLPCNLPFIMAGIDEQGLVIKRDQVPQSLRVGEIRICTGCHLHSRPGRPYEQSQAFSSIAEPLMTSGPVPDFTRDIAPILKRRCQGCHVNDIPLGNYDDLVWDRFQSAVPDDHRMKVSDSANEKRRWGLQRPYTSKYVNSMFARESLLFWKAANQRMDGRTDATYDNDIDFGPDHSVDILPEELKQLALWLDSGAPQNYPE